MVVKLSATFSKHTFGSKQRIRTPESVFTPGQMAKTENLTTYMLLPLMREKVFYPPEDVFRTYCKMVCIGFCKLGVAGELKIRGGQVPLEI